MARYSRGGLGDVRALPSYEFELYYAAMVDLNRREREAIKKEQDKAKA